MKKGRRLNKIIFLMLFVFIIFFGSLVFIKSDVFDLKYIVIKNNKLLADDEVKKISKIQVGRNIFTYRIKDIENNLKNSSYVEALQVKRNFPDTIEINIKEKDIPLILKDDENYYFVDDNLEYIEKVENKALLDKYPIVKISFLINDEKIVYKNGSDKKYLSDFIEVAVDEGIYKKIKEVDFIDEKIVGLVVEKNIKVKLNKADKIDENIKKLSKILVDLYNNNLYSGNINMIYKKYITYSY